jgi:hypothetical protein
MASAGVLDLDPIEELRMRRWARENYVPEGRREKDWHPVIHDEMSKKDQDLSGKFDFPSIA